MKFANWMRTNFRKENTMNILFSDEKMFDIEGVYNSHNDRICRAAKMVLGENVNFLKKFWRLAWSFL